MRTNDKDQKAKREKKSYYPADFRWKLIQELSAELLTEQQACEKYGITIILIRKWRKQYYQRKIQPLQTTQPMERKQDQTEKIKALEIKLKQTQKALQDEKVKSRAYEIMIEVAEQELKIPVRKKSGASRTADAAVNRLSREFPLVSVENLCQLSAVPLGAKPAMPSTRLSEELTSDAYKKLWYWRKYAQSKRNKRS